MLFNNTPTNQTTDISFCTHFSNLSPVVSRSLIATHRMNTCLGTAIENHTSLHQFTLGCFTPNFPRPPASVFS